MSTHRSHPFPRKFSRRVPDDPRYADGVRRQYLFACGANDRHRVSTFQRALDPLPGGRCPACGGALSLRSVHWEGEVPAEGYDPDAALEALAREGYYAWTQGGAP